MKRVSCRRLSKSFAAGFVGALGAAGRCGAVVMAEVCDGTLKSDDWIPAGGGIYCRQASPTIRQNVITGNATDLGGGLYLRGGQPLVERNFIAANSARHSGAAVGRDADNTRLASEAAKRGDVGR